MEQNLSALLIFFFVHAMHSSHLPSVPVHAQSGAPATETTASLTSNVPGVISPSPISLVSISGKVIKKEGTLLYLNSQKGVVSYDIPPQTTVMRNQTAQRLDAIESGDTVTIMQTPQGQVVAVTASAPPVFDLVRLLLAFASVGFLSSGIVLFLHLLSDHPLFQPGSSRLPKPNFR